MTPLIMVIAAAQVVVQAMALVMVYLMALLLAMASITTALATEMVMM